MEREQLKMLLAEIGVDAGKRGYYKDSGDNIQFCCPFHGETRPSCGINIYTEVGSCFACGTGYNIPKLVAHCMDWVLPRGEYNYAEANAWLEEKYNLDKKQVFQKHMGVIRIEDDEDAEEEPVPTRHEMSRNALAVFKSGKAIHDYFFERGFTKETARKFLVGWDEKRMRITVPVIWGDGVPCGIIGRAVLEMKIDGETNQEFFDVYEEGNNVKYHIYDNFPVGEILFPLPQFELVEDTAIIVEGQYDAMWCHQLGFPQTLASLGSKLVYNKRLQSSKQIDLLTSMGVKKVILIRDKDKAGMEGIERDVKLLKKEGIIPYGITYPKGKSDPQELTAKELKKMIENKHLLGVTKKIRRIED